MWRALRDRRPALWVVAVLLHVALDLAAFAAPQLWPVAGMVLAGLVVVGLAGAAGVAAWWAIRAPVPVR